MAARKQAEYQILSTKTHGIIDIGFVLVLIAAPFALGFANGGAVQWVPQALAVVLLISSMLTRYEWGMIGMFSMPMHLMLDVGAGAFLVASPWLFGFANVTYWPHVILGLIAIATAAMTKTQPQKGPMFA